ARIGALYRVVINHSVTGEASQTVEFFPASQRSLRIGINIRAQSIIRLQQTLAVKACCGNAVHSLNMAQMIRTIEEVEGPAAHFIIREHCSLVLVIAIADRKHSPVRFSTQYVIDDWPTSCPDRLKIKKREHLMHVGS